MSHINSEEREHEILDAESIKRRIERSRKSIVQSGGVDSFAPVSKETKALTTVRSRSKSYYDKRIIYCPGCVVQSPTHRMKAYEVSVLINSDNPGSHIAYEELVGGLPVPDDAVFFHCSRCNFKMLAEVDSALKMDAVTPAEYIIESVNDPSKLGNKKPVMVGASKRYNRHRDKKRKELEKNIQQAKEVLAARKDSQPKEALPSE